MGVGEAAARPQVAGGRACWAGPPVAGWRTLGEDREEVGGHRVRFRRHTGLVACCRPACHSLPQGL